MQKLILVNRHGRGAQRTMKVIRGISSPFRRKPDSRKADWIPAFAGMTGGLSEESFAVRI